MSSNVHLSGKKLYDRYCQVRQCSQQLTLPLSPEDMVVQSMADSSPAKWHLGHTTWFFETFLLRGHDTSYTVFDPDYAYLFNSYYESCGQRQPRLQRGRRRHP